MFLSDAQLQVPSIVSRWMMDDTASSQYVKDDVGGISLVEVGMPALQQLSLERHRLSSSGYGWYAQSTSTFNYWSASVTGFVATNGITVQGVTAQEPNGQNYHVFNAPGQVYLDVVAGTGVTFGVYTTKLYTVSSPNVLSGRAQLITGSYDPIAGIASLYVDGVLVNSLPVTGTVVAATTGRTTLLQPLGVHAGNYFCIGQDIAVYSSPLSKGNVSMQQQAFLQQWIDVGHVHSPRQVSGISAVVAKQIIVPPIPTPTPTPAPAVSNALSNSGAPMISGALTAGSTLTCTAGTWENASGIVVQPTSVVYQYQSCATQNGTFVALTGNGASTASYVLQTTGVGGYIRCQVIAYYGSVPSTPVYSNVLGPIVAAGTPTLSIPTITGTAQVGQTLTAAAVAAGTPTPTVTYQWYRVPAAGAPGPVSPPVITG
jgi:hypothetical protein